VKNDWAVAAAAEAATNHKGGSPDTEAAIKEERQIVARRQIKKTQELQWIAAQRLLNGQAAATKCNTAQAKRSKRQQPWAKEAKENGRKQQQTQRIAGEQWRRRQQRRRKAAAQTQKPQ
jgi:hypothetical protein